MILGGPPVILPDTKVRFLQLPGLKMDGDFSELIPCEEGAKLQDVQTKRSEQLLEFFLTFQPDVFLVELYPFGRKAFRFELDPILQGIESGELNPCLRLCSLRDILVEKTNKQKYETRVLSVLDTSFDGLLIHSDPAYIPLEKTFDSTEHLPVPHVYTGFISPLPKKHGSRSQLRHRLNITPQEKLIVASIGGGNVGEELLEATVQAAILLTKTREDIHFHLFTGIYAKPDLIDRLRETGGNSITVHEFSISFPEWLQAAELSISMAGYNTCMNLIRAGIPALLYPFAQNREQRMRITSFTETCNFRLLEEKDLTPHTLATAIIEQLQVAVKEQDVQLNGAEKSLELIEDTSLWRSSP
jgi:predicted glycosyltransferase